MISAVTINVTNLLVDSLGISVTDSFNSLTESVFEDADLDLSDLGDIAIFIFLAYTVGKGTKYLYNMFVGDPLEKLNGLIKEREKILSKICDEIRKRKTSIVLFLTPAENVEIEKKLNDEIKGLNVKLTILGKLCVNRIKPLSYYVIKEKIKLLKMVLEKFKEECLRQKIDVEDYLDKILMLQFLLVSPDANNLKKSKHWFCEMYDDRLSEGDKNKIMNEIKNNEQMKNLLCVVLNNECKKLLEIIAKFSRVFSELQKFLVEVNDDISNEMNVLKSSGKI